MKTIFYFKGGYFEGFDEIYKVYKSNNNYTIVIYNGSSKGQCMIISDNKGCYIYFNKDKNNIWFIKDKITNERFVEMIAKVIGNTIELDTIIT